MVHIPGQGLGTSPVLALAVGGGHRLQESGLWEPVAPAPSSLHRADVQ